MVRLDIKVRKKIQEIRDRYATKFQKSEASVGRRQSDWETVKEPKIKLYGQIHIEPRGNKVLILYKILKGWEYAYSPLDLDDKGNPKPGAQPIAKNPVVEPKVEEVK